jgi:tRNA-dihydrouridine synthase
VHYDFIARAVEAMPCPVLANGNVHSAQKAEEVLKVTGARGLMIGRGAIRNPWLFHQIRQFLGVARAPGAGGGTETHGRDADAIVFVPRGCDVLAYIRALYDAVCSPDVTESAQVQKMKKYMNYIGVGVDSGGQFLHQIRRVTTQAEFFRVCDAFLNHDQPMPLEPFPLKLKETDLMATE